MARFLCFNAQSHSHKTKRTSHMPIEAMKKTSSEDCPRNHLPTNIVKPVGLSPSHGKANDDTLFNNINMLANSSSIKRCWKSEEIKCSFSISGDTGIHPAQHHKKSFSLGNVVAQAGKESSMNEIGSVFDQAYSCSDAHDLSGIIIIGDKIMDSVKSVLDQSQEGCHSDSPIVSSEMVNNHSIFSVGDEEILDKEVHAHSDTHFSVENDGGRSSQITHSASHAVIKSPSLPNITAATQFLYRSLGHHSRSSDDLHALETRERDDLIGKVDSRENDGASCKAGKNNLEIIAEDGFESYNYFGTAKDWVVPVMDGSHVANGYKGESSDNAIDESPSMDFKIKRIEEWVVNLQHCSSLEKNIEVLHATDDAKRVSEINDPTAIVKLGNKATTGMEAAKRYISLLPTAANTVHLVNHGLAVIPFLSAFMSLKALNLSGNAIARITAGALPRGLHFLNLSRNCVSTIEGLRDLGRLRVLDLSYNRILRIGHGLASCSSLKELYLAGNKISEVEGLHRLLKLNVLDLRFNKISTAKCVGQLAANYSSMQAISLEGNPAQKNVGDEQLKKQLQSLLPHLMFYNRRPLKETSARLGPSSFGQQFERGARAARKGAVHGKGPGSSRKVVALSRGGRPPSVSRVGGRHQCNFETGGGAMGSKAAKGEVSMRRSRSEGTLGAV